MRHLAIRAIGVVAASILALVGQLNIGDHRAGAVAQSVLSVRDPRDGRTYPVVRLAGRSWLASNLDFKTAESWCYNNDQSRCTDFGRLYSLEAARIACIPGWELPSEADWLVLAAAFGGHYELAERRDVGNPRASYAALLEGGSSGFGARLGGSRDLETGKSMDLEGDGLYWSRSGCGADRISFMVFNEHNRRLLRDCYTPAFAHSVRCIRSGQ
jgi:uncharacterized protein (TIGR02145 family)